MQSTIYTNPRLCSCNNDLKKKWFVYFCVRDIVTGQKSNQQLRGNINHFKTVDERKKEGKLLIEYWDGVLKRGWSPFKTNQQLQFDKMTIAEALDFGLEKCDVAKKTRSCYGTTVNFFKKAAGQLFMNHLYISEVERRHVMLIMDKIKTTRRWSNKAYNKQIGYIQAVFSILEQWEIIKFNPAHKIKKLPVTETQKFVPFTHEEKSTIREYLFLNHYRFFIIVMTIYSTGMRPKEVLSLKIKDVDLDKRLITIIPDRAAENSKTRNMRRVPINNHLLSFYRQLNLEIYPPNYYIFGSPFIKGQGNRGVGFGAAHSDYLKPSPVQVKRDTITRLWNKIVMQKLGIKKYMYALKHTGANENILAGISLDALQSMYGHSSKLMTLKYATNVKDVYQKEIIEKSPEF